MSEEYSQMLVGEPADHPQMLVDSAISLFKTMPEVKKAWLLLVMHKNKEQNLLLVVDVRGDLQKAFQTIGKTVSACLEADQHIDMAPLDDFGKDMVRCHKPFYKKGIFSK